MNQADFFAEPLIAGLEYREDFISVEEERAGIESFRRSSSLHSDSRGGRAIGRRRATVGGTISTTRVSGRPSPFRMARARSQKAAALQLRQADGDRARSGRSIRSRRWHRLAHGSQRVRSRHRSFAQHADVLRFRQRDNSCFRRFSLPVEPRSAYLLSHRATPHGWEHRIVPGDKLRFSITFRTMSELGRRKMAGQRHS